MSPRKYEQHQRAEAAEETRRRILDAVYERLRAEPAQPLSLDQVAHDAGVSRSTVYLIFGSRTGVFEALAADLLEQGRFDRLVEAVSSADAREHLRGGLRASTEMLAVHRDVRRVLYSMAMLDPDAVGGSIDRSERERTGGIAYLAQRLGEQGLLRSDVTVDQAADLLWVLTSFDAFDLLYAGRGRTVDEITATLTTAAERSLLR